MPTTYTCTDKCIISVALLLLRFDPLFFYTLDLDLHTLVSAPRPYAEHRERRQPLKTDAAAVRKYLPLCFELLIANALSLLLLLTFALVLLSPVKSQGNTSANVVIWKCKELASRPPRYTQSRKRAHRQGSPSSFYLHMSARTANCKHVLWTAAA